ncbi:Carrier protein, mitochondrial [Paecilomyces lecythidis]|uniref:Carrier protein, mitochondrial n=1 Tax=Paecilomyces lecythidis TaxID=3004212 RepID=A0ABR3XIS0_9EURO
MASASSNRGQESIATAAQEGSENISVSQRMISATWGSLLTSLLVTPLDVVRVRLQSQPNQARGFAAHSTNAFKELPGDLGVTACCREVFWVGDTAQMCMVGPGGGTIGGSPAIIHECAVEETQRRTFTSTFDGLRKIARNEGIFTLWRGLSPTLVMAIPANVIYFTGYDWLRSDPRSPIPRFFGDAWAPLVAGSAARIAAASVISPIEMFKTRLQATSGTGANHFSATLKGLHQMTQVTGYGSLWRGLTLTLWRDVPFSGLYWWGYEEARKSLAIMRTKAQSSPDDLSYKDMQLHESNTSTFVDSFIAGASSGAFASLVTTPFDVGKTRQQIFRHSGNEIPMSAASQTTAKAVVHPEQLPMPKFLLHIFREEGLSGLFRGWAARCLKVAPACAIMISSYEVGKKMARGVNERRAPEGETA